MVLVMVFELHSQVQAPATVASSLDLLWFFTNTSGDAVQSRCSSICRVPVSGAATSFSQSYSQTYDMETDAVINRSSSCDIYDNLFTQSATTCASNVTSNGLPSMSTDDPSTNIDPAATSNAMSSLLHISIFDSSTTAVTNDPLQPDHSIICSSGHGYVH